MDKVIGIVLFLAFMAFLFKFTLVDKWWLWFALIIGVVVKIGVNIGTIGLIVAIIVWKVVKDLCTVSKKC